MDYEWKFCKACNEETAHTIVSTTPLRDSYMPYTCKECEPDRALIPEYKSFKENTADFVG